MAARHEALVNAILLELGSRRDIRCWRTQPGKYRYLYRNGVVTIGPDGIGDIAGILAPHGRAFFVECKVGRDSQSDSQCAFQRMCGMVGAIYVMAYSVEDAVNGLYDIH